MVDMEEFITDPHCIASTSLCLWFSRRISALDVSNRRSSTVCGSNLRVLVPYGLFMGSLLVPFSSLGPIWALYGSHLVVRVLYGFDMETISSLDHIWVPCGAAGRDT